MTFESDHINAAIAFFALLASLYSVWLTQSFNKKQQEVNNTQADLNKILLEKEKEEVLTQKQADVSASIIKLGKNDYRLRICNQGKALARNVKLVVPADQENYFCIDEKLPIDLHRLGSVDIFLSATLDSPSKYIVQLTWDDEYALQREKTLHLTY